jgi:hypothetical protein
MGSVHHENGQQHATISRSHLKQLEAGIADKRKVEDSLRDQIKTKQEEIESLYCKISDLQDIHLHSSTIPDEVGLLRQRIHLRDRCEELKKEKMNLQGHLGEVLDEIERMQDCWRVSWTE